MISVMTATIQINDSTILALDKMKVFKDETYDDILEKLIEDVQELNDETKKEIEFALKEIEKGNYITHENLAKEIS